MTSIYQKHPEFNYVGRLLTEKYYIDLMERTLCLQFQTAKESYEQLVATHPHILKRASLGHIASYLGVSQETLSRIRAKKWKYLDFFDFCQKPYLTMIIHLSCYSDDRYLGLIVSLLKGKNEKGKV